MLKRSEWNDIAEKSAAATAGAHHWRKYAFRRNLPLYAGLTVLAALGFGVWWVQDKAREAWAHRSTVAAPSDPGVPLWLFVVFGVLALVTFVAFRPGRGTDSAPVLLGKVFGLGVLWLVSLGLLVGFAL